jgi:hypothetical protein
MDSPFSDLQDNQKFKTYFQTLFTRANPGNPNEINEKQLLYLMNVIANERKLQILTENDANELFKEIAGDRTIITKEEFENYFRSLM